MKIKCDYCDSTYEDTLPSCPNCGAPNPTQKSADGAPRTIEELSQWYRDRNLPPEHITRFFIGKDVREARAFGIYRDPNSGEFIVYKNKADGSRAVRYQGRDETFAVNELYQRLKDEIVNQKHNNASAPTNRGMPLQNQSAPKPKSKAKRNLIIVLAVVVLCYIVGTIEEPRHAQGYYVDNGRPYYYATEIGSKWYTYDDDGNWVKTEEPAFYTEHRKSEALDAYFLGDSYSASWAYDENAFTDVTDSANYLSDKIDYEDTTSYAYSSSSDSSYDWDSNDSWDSGYTDWDSDW